MFQELFAPPFSFEEGIVREIQIHPFVHTGESVCTPAVEEIIEFFSIHLILQHGFPFQPQIFRAEPDPRHAECPEGIGGDSFSGTIQDLIVNIQHIFLHKICGWQIIESHMDIILFALIAHRVHIFADGICGISVKIIQEFRNMFFHIAIRIPQQFCHDILPQFDQIGTAAVFTVCLFKYAFHIIFCEKLHIGLKSPPVGMWRGIMGKTGQIIPDIHTVTDF